MIKYIPEEELIVGMYYYVHNYYPDPLVYRRKTVEIRKYAGHHDWYCNGLGSGGRWLAIDIVPEIDINDYIIED